MLRFNKPLSVIGDVEFLNYLLSVSADQNDKSRVAEIKAEKLTEIAMLLGTSYRHLNRIIGKFRHDGILSKEKGALTVLDLAKLKSLAKENIYE